VGERIPGVGGDKLERIALRAAASIRDLGTNREVLSWSLTWAAMNWLLDAASLWCFIAAFGGHANPVGLFAAYGVANVVGAIPITPGGLGIIDTLTPFLLVGFGLTRSVATLGVLAWRLVNFWLPIPTGALAYVSLKVPRGAGLGAMRRALSDLVPIGHRDHQQAPADDQADAPEYPDDQAPGERPSATDGSGPATDGSAPAADSRDARR
jgi:hypothetical protein